MLTVGASFRLKLEKQLQLPNEQGKFSISVPKDTKTILVSYVGMKEQKVDIGKDMISVSY